MLQRALEMRQGAAAGSRLEFGVSGAAGEQQVPPLRRRWRPGSGRNDKVGGRGLVLCALTPAFELRPEAGPGIELLAAADVDVDLLFQGVGVVGGRAYVFHVVPELFEAFSAVVED